MKFTAILCVCLVLAGCFGLVARDDSHTSALDKEVAEALLTASLSSGGNGFDRHVETGVVDSATGCALHYRLYRPEAARTEDLVVLGHGFLRSQERMADLARAFSDAGIPTVTLDFCNARFWDGRHVRNGLDMIRVADALDANRVVYAGFSAGGLAALVAGRNDPRTLGVVALDLVDAGRLGEGMAAGLDRPLIGLVGDPSPCNAENNGLAVFSATDRSSVERVTGAEHCDFESPTDWLCRLVCKRDAPEEASPRRDIIAAATDAVVSLVAPPSQAKQADRWAGG
ncbi:alpha/beta fold hydrolase [Thiocapsa rosea]|uniref:Alpha-beta hydrolase superfamily lysophospholipase n=1 Tax=Thiocapsa rosea TaxID=69360 RepID=A0A495V8D0_9GAMM|nr:alpha/beta hydrolase [Thiocapsa rosea]RKT44617.1 alpha-beta hydrolase superfamily lysophospholipase [Thiocapsa rosea]